MMNLKTVVLVCVLVKDVICSVPVDTCARTSTHYCSLFTFGSDLVSVQDLMDKVTSDGWFMIYGSEFYPLHNYGKCNYKWTPTGTDRIIKRQLICFNYDLGKCESFDSNVRWQDDECGRVSETGVDYTVSGKFFSQDLQQYLLYYTCYNYTSPGNCADGYLDIMSRDNRYKKSPNKELDLQGIPWHLIAADVKNNFGLDLSSPKVIFNFKGPECGFDGTLVSDDAYRQCSDCFMMFTLLFLTLEL